MGQEPKPTWRWVTESGTQAGSMAMNEVLYVNKEGFQDQCFLLFNTGLSLGQIWLVFFSLPKQKWTIVPCWNNLWNNWLYMEAIKNWKCYQSPPLKVGTKIRDHLHYSPSKVNKDQKFQEVPTEPLIKSDSTAEPQNGHPEKDLDLPHLMWPIWHFSLLTIWI